MTRTFHVTTWQGVIIRKVYDWLANLRLNNTVSYYGGQEESTRHEDRTFYGHMGRFTLSRYDREGAFCQVKILGRWYRAYDF